MIDGEYEAPQGCNTGLMKSISMDVNALNRIARWLRKTYDY